MRTGKSHHTHLVFPEHLKYDQTQKAPYAALLDRLRAFLGTPDTALISIGFSFADLHIASRIDEGLAGNPSAGVFAFQYRSLADESAAAELAKRRPNFSVYAADKAIINGIAGPWVVPPKLPSRDWAPIRQTYWSKSGATDPERFTLGGIESFARFLAASRSAQAFSPAVPTGPAAGTPPLVTTAA